MGKIYLQEKIEPVPGKYVIVGDDGFLTTGDLPSEARPQIVITAPEGLSTSNFAVTCNNNTKNVNISKVSDTLYMFYATEFGVWKVIASTPSQTLQEDVDVYEIRNYYITLSYNISPDDPDQPTPSDPTGPASLEESSWSTIKSRADAGLAGSYYSLGDRKSVVLSGTMGTISFSGNYTIYAYIIGFDHNSGMEGAGITFQFGFPSSNSDKRYAFVDSYYGTSQSDNNNSFHINYATSWTSAWNPNSSKGWGTCIMRSTVLNGDTNSLYSCLPSALKSVCSEKRIYTDNYDGTGTLSWGSDSLSNISVTLDKIFLLSEFEIFGQRTYADSYEQQFQKQYDYYKTYTKVKYKHSSSSAKSAYWTRSRTYNTKGYFCAVDTSGNIGIDSSLEALGIAPAFFIGSNIPSSTNIYITSSGNTVTSSRTYSSYVKINGTIYSDSGKYLVNSGDSIIICGKSGRVSTDDGYAYTYVRVKLNGTAVGSASSHTNQYDDLYTYVLGNDVKGIINIALKTGTAGSFDTSSYVTIDTTSMATS